VALAAHVRPWMHAVIPRSGGSLYSGLRLPLHGALQQVQGEVDGHFEQRLCCAAGGAGDCRL